MKKSLVLILLVVTLVAALAIGVMGCKSVPVEKVKMVSTTLSTGEEYAFIVKQSDTALLTQANEFLAAKSKEVEEIISKYTAEDADLTSFGITVNTTPSIEKMDSQLVVATNAEFAPFEYMNGSKFAGIDIEIMKLLADYLNQELVIVNMEFDAVVESVQQVASYDIGAAGLTITPERAEVVTFTSAYFGTTQAIIVNKDDTTFDDCKTAAELTEKLASLTGAAAKCGGQTGTTSQFFINGSEDFEFDGFANLTFAPYSSAAVAVQDMINGNIAFVVVDKTVGEAIVASINS